MAKSAAAAPTGSVLDITQLLLILRTRLCLSVLFYKYALFDTFKSMSSLNEIGVEGLLEILSHLSKPIAILTYNSYWKLCGDIAMAQ